MARTGRRAASYKDWITDEGLVKLEGWAKSGLTDEQIANNIGIARNTIYLWKNKYPEIDKALKKGKEIVDFEVENKLLKRAMGFEYTEEKVIVEKDERGKDRKRIERTTRLILPDTTAQIFWLKNRKPNEWRNNKTDLDLKEQEARIDKHNAQIEKLKGIASDIEDTTALRKLLLDE